MSGINPKTNWQAGDGIKASDLNEIGNQFWENVYGVFDIGGYRQITPSSENFSSEDFVVERREIIIPPQTKLLLTHASMPISGINNYNGIGVNGVVVPNIVFTWTGNTIVFPPNTAPIIYTNNTNTEVFIIIVVYAYPEALGGGSSSTTGASVRVIITPLP